MVGGKSKFRVYSVLAASVLLVTFGFGAENASARRLSPVQAKSFQSAKPLDIPLSLTAGTYTQPEAAVLMDADTGRITRIPINSAEDQLPLVDNGAGGPGSTAPIISPISPPDPRIAQIIVDDPNGGTYGCSGTLVGNRYVLTAGHCIHQGGGGQFYKNAMVALGYENGSAMYGPFKAMALVAFSGWTDAGDNKDDVALIVVQRGVPDDMYFRFGVRAIDPKCAPQSAITIQYERRYYSGTYERFRQQGRLLGEMAGCHLGMITNPIGTGHGSSGSAAIDRMGQYAFAVHSAEDFRPGHEVGFDALLTRAKACFVYYYMQNAVPPSSPVSCFTSSVMLR